MTSAPSPASCSSANPRLAVYLVPALDHSIWWRFGQLLLASALILAGGCRLFRSRGPTDEDTAAARQLCRQGLDAQQRHDWQRAELLFAAAIVKSPGDERARWGYAESLWRRGDYDGAIASMEDAVRLSGHDPERRVRLGTMYLSRGEVALALQEAQRAIASNPQLASAWALRGKAEHAAGALGEALSSFHRALSLDAGLTDAQLAVADIYAQQNRPQRALATIQALADRFPAHQVPAEVFYQEALALRALGRPSEAATCFAQAVQRNPQRLDWLLELARTNRTIGDTTAAWQAIHTGLARDPRHAGFRALANEMSPSPDPVVTAAAVSDSPLVPR